MITDEVVYAALNAQTEDLPESAYYALLRGLHAMGFALPKDAAFEVMRSALEAAAPMIRAAALEEAAEIAENYNPCEAFTYAGPSDIADAIRALKEQT